MQSDYQLQKNKAGQRAAPTRDAPSPTSFTFHGLTLKPCPICRIAFFVLEYELTTSLKSNISEWNLNYQNLVRDFANRTRKNLETLRKLQKTGPDTEIYEVTQLINSMLGLLVFPQQTYFDSIPETPIAELKSQGWPVPKVEGNYPQAKNLRELFRYLRNAITHCNLEFLADDINQIRGLRVWNTDHRKNQTTWRTSLTIEDIELITEKFIQLLLEGVIYVMR